MSSKLETGGWVAFAFGLLVDAIAQLVAPHVVDPIVRAFQ